MAAAVAVNAAAAAAAADDDDDDDDGQSRLRFCVQADKLEIGTKAHDCSSGRWLQLPYAAAAAAAAAGCVVLWQKLHKHLGESSPIDDDDDDHDSAAATRLVLACLAWLLLPFIISLTASLFNLNNST